VRATEQIQSWDPRSPTLGISRTPMKAVMADTINCLVKQLSEAFGAETMEHESLLEKPLDQGPNLGAACVPGEETNGKNPQGEGSARVVSQEKIPMRGEEKQPPSNTCAQPKYQLCSTDNVFVVHTLLPIISLSRSSSSVPNLEEAVPGASSHGHAICCHPQTAHPVVMTGEDP
uniref:Cell division cycle associated 3 n=1 Tax=Terrapene triunguis TaxID=2587831 RepID=A0A674IQW2_9SAUR